MDASQWLSRIVLDAARAGGRPLALTSTSIVADELESIAESIRRVHGPLPSYWEDGKTPPEEALARAAEEQAARTQAAVIVSEPPLRPNGVGYLAVANHFSDTFSLPAGFDDSGSVTLSVPLPEPSADGTGLTATPSIRWEVDIQWNVELAPRGHGVLQEALLAGSENRWSIAVRDARDGISYNSWREDLFVYGTDPRLQLARPRLHQPGLTEWINHKAATRGYSAELSDAGRRAQILADMVGGRASLETLLAGTSLLMLREFLPNAKTSSEAYPQEDGVVLFGEGYLTLPGLVRALNGSSADEPTKAVEASREEVDRLLAWGLLTRGLVLACERCHRPTFYSIEQLAQTFVCQRCRHQNSLAQARWRKPVDEPAWHYDLHPVARDLLKANGDVPVALSRYLRRQTIRPDAYADVAEMDFFDADGQRVAEADLIALQDGALIVAEAKSNSTLESGSAKARREAARKRVLIASILDADQIVLATTQQAWGQQSLADMRSAVEDLSWPLGRRPTIRIIESVASDAPSERRL